ncbi:MAG: TlpA family protein disulfide reductase [Deltaproteobacteria bacterium]|nr:TlpA family protein disulfide reductase [Deltaproteobacteria bacterium]MBW2394228.1 TlpA family protein disulfide reductase [Deltaproteobacteria bacterium]
MSILGRGLAALVLVSMILSCGPLGAPEAGDGDERAPGFDLATLDGRQVSLDSLAGRPAVIDFWATWCAPCIRQIPVLNALQAEYGGGVSVVGIAVDTSGAEVVAPFAEEHEMAYTVLLGDERLAQAYGALGFPTLFVLDGEGRIVEAHVGIVTMEELQDALARAGA